MRLEHKVALVTGAGNGIGKACALMFSRHGAKVIACDRDVESLRETERAAAAAGCPLDSIAALDLTREEEVNAVFQSLGQRAGAFHILLNAAASARFAPLEELSYCDWRHTLVGEIDSVFLATRAAWPYLKLGKGASIINFASANAYHALEGSPALAHCAGKGGVLAMTRQLAMEGAPHQIRANTISPGFIQTAATMAHLARDPALRSQVLAKNMVKRLGIPDDIAWCATWLASEESTYVTGSDVRIDGGATAW